MHNVSSIVVVCTDEVWTFSLIAMVVLHINTCIHLHKIIPMHFNSQMSQHHYPKPMQAWWRHQMETFSALLAFCAGNSPVTSEFPQRPVTRNFDVFFDLRQNKRSSKRSWGWWFETTLHSLWSDCNEYCKCINEVPGDIFRWDYSPDPSIDIK